MAKERDAVIASEIENILCNRFTSADLAQAYLRNRPRANVEQGDRDEIARELSGLDVIAERPELLNGIVDAYFHFSAHILFEGGFFSNNRINDLLLTPDQITGRIDDGMAAYELVSNAPVLVEAKSVLIAKNNLVYLTREPFYLESSQVTELQMVCLNIPEAIDEVLRLMGERPFIRSELGEDRPYLRAFVRVLNTLMESGAGSGGAGDLDSKTLIAAILTAFYHEYLSFPTEDYLADLVGSVIQG